MLKLRQIELKLKQVDLKMKSIIGALSALTALTAITTVFTGCAKQEFVKKEYVAQASSTGFRYIPAKVDIVIVGDNTGSINGVFSTLQSSLYGFANTLTGKFWDYHVGRLPLVGSAPLGNVLVNETYNKPYLPDGTYIGNTGGLVPDYAVEKNIANFNIISAPLATGSADYTYSNLINNLRGIQNNNSINFLRQDALLAVIVVTNGYEASVSDAYAQSINYTQLQNHANQLIALKGSANTIRFYPVAARYYSDSRTGTSCFSQGGTSFRGDAYFAMNNYIRGTSADFCDAQAMYSVLDRIEADLKTVRQSYVYSYLVLDEKPIESSITLTKKGQTIPKSNQNGWSYLGGPRTVGTVTHIQEENGSLTALNPPLNQRTGYVIQLNGNARVIGRQDSNSDGAPEIEISYQKE